MWKWSTSSEPELLPKDPKCLSNALLYPPLLLPLLPFSPFFLPPIRPFYLSIHLPFSLCFVPTTFLLIFITFFFLLHPLINLHSPIFPLLSDIPPLCVNTSNPSPLYAFPLSPFVRPLRQLPLKIKSRASHLNFNRQLLGLATQLQVQLFLFRLKPDHGLPVPGSSHSDRQASLLSFYTRR